MGLPHKCFSMRNFANGSVRKKSPIPLFLNPTFLFHLLAFSMPISFINHPHSMIYPCYFHGISLNKISIPWRKGCKMYVVWQFIDLLTWFFHTKKQWRKCGKDASADSSGGAKIYLTWDPISLSWVDASLCERKAIDDDGPNTVHKGSRRSS